MDKGRWSRRSTAVWCVVALALEFYVLTMLPFGRVSENGVHATVLKELGAGAVVTQVFTMRNVGLHALRVQVWTSGATDLDLECRLSTEAENGKFKPLATIPVALHDVSGARAIIVEFPPVAESAGGTFAMAFRVVAARPRGTDARRDVGLVASRDLPPAEPLHAPYLLIDGRPRWGDLTFDAIAAGDTALGRFRLTAVAQLPNLLRHNASLVCAIVLYNVLLLGVAQVLGRDAGAPVGAARPVSPTPARVRGALLVLLLLSAFGVAVSMAARARRGINLLEQLYAADLTAAPGRDTLRLLTVEIGVETRQAIFAQTPSRIVWHLTIPSAARLTVGVAIHPDAWGVVTSDGAVFRITAIDQDEATELFMKQVRPQLIVSDRQWIPVNVDLSPFAGHTIDLVFASEPSMPGQAANMNSDFTLWAAPRITTGSAID